LYVGSALSAVEEVPHTNFPEHVWCKIRICNGTELLVGVCYRSPNKLIHNDNHSPLRDLIREIHCRNFVLMGDFNYPDIDWSGLQAKTPDSQLFVETLDDCFVTQHVVEPTRQCHVLDLVITREPAMIDVVNVLEPFGTSDHHMLQWSVNITTNHMNQETEKLDYAKANYEGIRRELGMINWEQEMMGTAEDCWNSLKNKLEELEHQYVPIKKIKIGTRKKPLWMTYKALKLVTKKNRLYKKYKDKDHPAYTACIRRAKNELRGAKCNFECKLARNIKKDVKSFYAYVSSMSKTRVKVGPLVDGNGRTSSSASEMTEQLNDYFSSVFTEENCFDMPTVEERFCPTGKLLNVTIDETAVRKKLDKLRADKAPGADNMYPRLLKELVTELCFPLTIILRRSLEEGEVPEDWKLANVTPIYKKGSRGQVGNYRPVSLTSQVCKVFESIIRDALMEHLSSNNINFTPYTF
jgi:hypothetical protein